jgi:ABC-type branched-subunit amino acid transport system permease subunit/ABC-type branched-subunit amino acid transport system ATPase component
MRIIWQRHVPLVLIAAGLVAFDLAYGDLMIVSAVPPGQSGALLLWVPLVVLALALPVLVARAPLLRRKVSAPPTLRAAAALVPLLLGWALAVILTSVGTGVALGDLFAASGALFGLLLLHAWGFTCISQLAADQTSGSIAGGDAPGARSPRLGTETPAGLQSEMIERFSQVHNRVAWAGAAYGLAVAVVWSGVDLVLAAQGGLGLGFALATTGARLVILPALGLIAGRWGTQAEGSDPAMSASVAPSRARSDQPFTFRHGLLWIALIAVLLAVFFTPTSVGQTIVQFGARVVAAWAVLVVGVGLLAGAVVALARLRPRLPDVRAGLGRVLRVSHATPARQTLWATGGLLALCCWPYLDAYLVGNGTDARVSVLGDIGFYVILALGLNIVVGFAGLLDLGYVAFFAIGAYSWALLGAPQFSAIVALFHQLDGLPLLPQQLPFGLAWAWWFWPCLIIGALVAAGFGVVLGAPTLRLRGDYLAIVTLGFGEIIPIVFKNLPRLTNGINGVDGVPSPILPGLAFPWFAATPFYYLILALIGLTIISCRRLRGARLGRSWQAMRDDHLAAASAGINTVRVKLLAFSTGAFFAGLAGVYHAAKLGIIDPSQFSFGDSAAYVTMVVLGGMGSIPGVIAGAVVIAALNLYLLNQLNVWSHDPTTLLGQLPLLHTIDFADFRNLIFGLLLFTMVVLRPAGIIPARAARAPADAIPEPDEPFPQSPSASTVPHDPLLRIRHVSKTFGGVVALSDITLNVAPGQMVGIIGPNGSGKTTLFNLISGVVPPDPRPGTIAARGRRIARRAAALVRRRPGVLLRWALGTVLGLGVGLAFVAYVLNVVIFAAISDPTYLQPLVTLAAVAWAVVWLATRCYGLFLGSANGLWAELDGDDGTLSGNAGAVRLGEHALLGLAPEQIAARGVARTFQHIRLFESLSVLDNLLVGQDTHLHSSWLDALLGSRRMRREERTARERALATLALFGPDLVARQHEMAAQLAYADKRRVEICRALVAEPHLLLLDEPTAGMNEDETQSLLAVLRRICIERRLTLLLIEHKLAAIAAVDQVIALDQGHVIASGTPAEVRQNDQVIAAYLGRQTASQTLFG